MVETQKLCFFYGSWVMIFNHGVKNGWKFTKTPRGEVRGCGTPLLNNKMKFFKTITYLSIFAAVAAMSFEKRRSNIQAQNYFKDMMKASILARSKAFSFTIQTRIQMQKEEKFRQSIRKLLGKDKPVKNQFQSNRSSKDLGSKNQLEKFRG